MATIDRVNEQDVEIMCREMVRLVRIERLAFHALCLANNGRPEDAFEVLRTAFETKPVTS